MHAAMGHEGHNMDPHEPMGPMCKMNVSHIVWTVACSNRSFVRHTTKQDIYHVLRKAGFEAFQSHAALDRR